MIDEDYILLMAEEINEKIAHRGEISVNDLTTQLDLPSDFLQRHIIEKHLGKTIKARQDPTNPRIFFTQVYLQRCKAKMRGCLAAIKKPMNVTVIAQQINVPVKLFFYLFDEVNPAGHLSTRQANNSQYIPNIYIQMQNDWIQNFYRQNGFLEYDAIQKLGIANPKQYLSKQFLLNSNVNNQNNSNNGNNNTANTQQLIFLKRCAVNIKLIELTIIPALMATTQFIDLCSLLPTNMSASDREELFDVIMNMEQKTLCPNNYVIISDDTNSSTVVFTNDFLDKELLKPCRELAEKKAKMAVDNGSYQLYLSTTARQQQHQVTANKNSKDDSKVESGRIDKREERRRKAAASGGGKTGGGTQGRETKSKSTKKHPRSGGKKHHNDDDDEYDDDNNDNEIGESNTRGQEGSGKRKLFELLTIEELCHELNKTTKTIGLEDLDKNIATRYYEYV